jgi:hypothetical protein
LQAGSKPIVFLPSAVAVTVRLSAPELRRAQVTLYRAVEQFFQLSLRLPLGLSADVDGFL